ncbi:alpha-2-macroglobulin family protein [Spirochaeta dissipatitropha]
MIKSNLEKISAVLLLICLGLVVSCGAAREGDLEGWATSGGRAVSEVVPYGQAAVSGFIQGSIVYYEAAADAAQDKALSVGTGTEPAGDVRIIDWGPVDELPAENRRPRVYVSFSHPMVPLAMLGEVQYSSSILQIEPELPGVYRWYGSRTLVFIPDNPIDAQQPVQISVDSGLRSAGGAVLHEDYHDFSFSFFRERLKLVQAFPGRGGEPIDHSEIPPEQRIFSLRFNSPVDADHVSSFIDVEFGPVARPRNVEFTVRHPESAEVEGDENLRRRSLILELSNNLPENTALRIGLRAGASAFPGYMESLVDEVRSFHSITPFEYREYSSRSYMFPRSEEGDSNPIFLEFSHELDPTSLEGNIDIDLELDEGRKLSDYIEVFRNVIRLNNLPVVYESSYSLQIGAGIRDVYGRETGQEQSVEIEIPRAARYYYFPNAGSRFLEAQFVPRIIFEHQNMDDGVWRIDSITDPFSAFSASSLYPYDFSAVPENTRWFDVKDLRPYLNESGKGWVGISWNFAEKNDRGVRPTWSQTNLQLQVTDMGVTVRYAYNQVLVWIRSLTDNSPVVGADVRLLPGSRGSDYGNRGLSDADGLAVINLEPGEFQKLYRDQYQRDELIIRVENADDIIEFKPNYSHNTWAHGIRASVNPGRIEDGRRATFMFSDRGLYRPGETMSFRGIDRNLVLGEYEVYSGYYTIRLVSSDWRVDRAFGSQTARATENGGFHGSFDLDSDLAPGLYYLEYQRRGAARYDYERVPVQVAHFRNAAFSVDVKAPAVDVIMGEDAGIGISAEYLSGGGMTSAEYFFDVIRGPVLYQPPGIEWAGYRFGPLHRHSGRGLVSQGSGQLDGTGRAVEQVRTESAGSIEGMPQQYQFEARVQDADSQEIAGRAAFVVHPAEIYAGLRIPGMNRGYWGGYFVEAGKIYSLESQLVHIDGRAVAEDYRAGRDFSLEVIETRWKLVQQQGIGGRMNTRYEREQVSILNQELDLRGGAADLEFEIPSAGTYTLRLQGSDSAGRKLITELTLYASGSGFTRWWADDSQMIGMQPDRAEYRVGDTAEIFVQTPLPHGEYLLTIEREGIFSHELITIEGSQTVLNVPIEDHHVPVIYVMLSSASERQETPKNYFEPDLGKPQGYFGAAVLEVNPEPRRFDIEIIPAAGGFEPGGTAEVRMKLSRDGKPVAGAEVSFMAVDRGVLDLINYRVPDPVAFFYNPYRFPLGTAGADSRSLLIDPVTYEVKNLQGGDAGGEKMDERKDFRPTAIFEPYLLSDENGIIDLEIDLPDSLTTYRLTAVGVYGNSFALRESEILVSNPMPMRASLPRLLRERDTAIAGVVVRNLQSGAQNVTLSLAEIAGREDGLLIDGSAELQLRLEAGETREFAFQLAAMQEGSYELVFDLLAEDAAGEGAVFRDRMRSSLRVERSLNPETVSVFGTIGPEAEALEQFLFPSSAAQGFGELRLQLHGSRLYQLAAQAAALDRIWHSSLSSRISRFSPSLLLGSGFRDLTGRPGADAEEIDAFVRSIATLQHEDGGFVEFSDVLQRSTESSLWTTLRAAHFLAEYEAESSRGLPGSLKIQALRNKIDSIIQDRRIDFGTRAYAYYVRSMLYGSNLGTARSLLEYGDELGMDGLGFIALGVLQNSSEAAEAERIARDSLRRMMNMVNISPRGVDFLQTYEARTYFDAPARRLALLHMLLSTLEPDSDHLDRIAHTLVREINSGQWSQRDDQLWGLRAMAPRYGAGTQGDAAGTVGRYVISLDGQEIAAGTAPGLYDPAEVSVLPLFDEPLNELPRNQLLELGFASTAVHPLQYTALMNYSLPDELISARDEGIGVSSWIEKTDGTIIAAAELRRGETYRMVVNLEAPSRYYNLALRVPVPSGAEIVDGSLQTSGQYAADGGVNQRSWTRETDYGDTEEYTGEGYFGFGSGGWWTHWIRPIQRIYDGELQYYFGSVYAGSQTVSFLFRAVYPGVYPLASAHAELIDEPEVFGRSGGVLSVIQ